MPVLVVVTVAGIAASAAAYKLPRGPLRYRDVPVAMVALPVAVAAPAAAEEATPPATVPATAPAPMPLVRLVSRDPEDLDHPPASVDARLLEATAAGAVPRVAEDGRNSISSYAGPGDPVCAEPCVGIVVSGLGLAEEISARALALPAVVGLSFSPYAETMEWQARARRAGHEALLDLPLQPTAYPRDDSGPLTVRVADAAGVDATLLQVLAKGQGYVALAAEAGAFAAQPAAFAAIAHDLQHRGLGFVELGGASLGTVARSEGLSYVAAQGPVAAAEDDGSLAALEADARRLGMVVAFALPTPAGLDRLEAWLRTLPDKGLHLAPPSRLLAAASPQQMARP